MEYNNNFEFELLKFNAKFIFDHATFENGVIKLDDTLVENAIKSRETKRNCHVFAQTLKQFSYLTAKEIQRIYILMDFKDFKDFDKLAEYPNGVELCVNGEKATYVMFLKSNSMSKHSTMLYIDKEYYDIINERVNFGYDKVDNLVLAKWFAYSGLSLTDITMINNLTFDYEEVAIVDDCEIVEYAPSCITGVSIPLILDKLTQYRDSDNNKERNEIRREFKEYTESPDFKKLSIKNLILDSYELLQTNNFKELDTLIKENEEKIRNDSEIIWEKIKVKKYPISVNVFDGEGLIDSKCAEIINHVLNGQDYQFVDEDEELEYDENGFSNSFQIRLPFIKGVVHACDFKDFFKEHGITQIKGLAFSTKEKYHTYDVDNLKMILTKSQFKAASIFKAILEKSEDKDCLKEYFDNIKKNDYCLGISGLEPKQSENVKLCYQFLSTLPLEDKNLDALLKYNDELLAKRVSEEEMIIEMKQSQDPKDQNFIKTYKKNRNLALTFDYLHDRRTNLFTDRRPKLKVGQLMCEGQRRMLCGDLLWLLYHIAGLEMNEFDQLDKEGFYAPGGYFQDEQEFVFLRNPHYSRNEIVCLTSNLSSYEREKYFGKCNGVVMLNPLSFASERLGGADYDGDTVIILKNEAVIEDCLKHLYKNGKESYPVVKIPSLKIKRTNRITNSYPQKIKCLHDTFNNFTGLISNIAYDAALHSYTSLDYDESNDNVAFYTILGGLEIDSAKSGKKPSLKKAKRGKDEPDFILLKDHIIDKKNIMDWKTIEKRFIASNANDAIYKTYVHYNKLRLKKLTFEPINIKGNEHLDLYNAERIIVSYETYCFIRDALNSIVRINKSNVENTRKYIVNKVTEIFAENGYDQSHVIDFINKFNTNDPHKVMNDYINSENKFHFMNNIEDKEKYLKYLGFNLNDFYKRIVTNFNNGGYMLLYLALYYHKLPVKNFEINSKPLIENENSFIHCNDHVFSLYSEDEVSNITNKIIENLTIFDNNVNLNQSITKIKEDLERYIKIDYQDITLSDLKSIFNFKKEDIMFSVYYPIVAKYIREGK